MGGGSEPPQLVKGVMSWELQTLSSGVNAFVFVSRSEMQPTGPGLREPRRCVIGLMD